MLTKIMLFLLLAFNLFIFPQGIDFFIMMGDTYYSYTAVNVGSTVSEGQIIFSGASTRTKADKTTGTTKATKRYIHWKLDGAAYDSVYGYSKVLTSITEDSIYLWYQSVYANDGTFYNAAAVDTAYSSLSVPTNINAYNTTPTETTVSWNDNASNEDRIVFMASTDTGSTYSDIDTLAASTESYNYTGLTASTNYVVKVRYEGTYAADVFSDTLSFTTEASAQELTYDFASLDWGTIDSVAVTIGDIDTTIASIDTTVETTQLGLVDFEEGDTTDFSSATVDGISTFTVADTNAINGTYGIVFEKKDGELTLGRLDFTAQDSGYVRFYCSIDPDSIRIWSSAAGFEFMTIRNSTTKLCELSMATTTLNFGTDRFYFNGYVNHPGGIDLSEFRVDIFYKKGTGADGVLKLWVDATDSTDTPLKEVTNDASTLAMDNIIFGLGTASGRILGDTSWFRMDDIKVSKYWIGAYVGGIDTTYNYDTTYTYSDSTLTLTATNTGSEQIIIDSARVDALPFQVVNVDGDTVSIGAKKELSPSFRYSYNQGDYSDTLFVYRTGSTDTIPLTGTVNYPIIAPPTNLAVTHNTDTSAFLLTWTDWTGEDGFDSVYVYRSTDNETFTKIAVVDSGVATYTDSLPYSKGTLRYFRLTSKRDDTESTPSSSVGYTLPTEPGAGEVEDGVNDWFVDNTASGLNNGTSWTNAWESFADINWSSIQAGDSVFISGGTDSIQYNEQLNIGKSGTISSYIVITKGKSTGYNSKVVIDGGQTRAACIANSSYRYLKVEKLKLTNSDLYNIGLSGSAGKMTFDSLEVYNPNGTNMGARLWVVDSITIQNSTFWSDSVGGDGSLGEGDCIIMNGGNPNYEGGHIIHNNTFTMNNSDPDNHSDVVQSYFVNGCEFYNNYIIINNEKTNNSSGLYWNGNGGTWKIYNNVIIARSSGSINGKLTLYEASGGVDIDTLYLCNNSFLEASYPGFAIRTDIGANTTDAYVVIKNNAFRSGTAGQTIKINYTGSDSLDIDNNYMGAFTGTANRQVNGSTVSFATWQSTYGFDTNGANEYAEYTTVTEGSENLIPAVGSNLLENGETDPAWFFSDDYLGTSRPQSTNWDVGAYEKE